jgi:hypothetical protein
VAGVDVWVGVDSVVLAGAEVGVVVVSADVETADDAFTSVDFTVMGTRYLLDAAVIVAVAVMIAAVIVPTEAMMATMIATSNLWPPRGGVPGGTLFTSEIMRTFTLPDTRRHHTKSVTDRM